MTHCTPVEPVGAGLRTARLPHPLKWGPREGVWPSWGEEKPRHRWNFPLAGNETLCLVLRRAGGGTFLFRQESTQRDDLGGGGGRDVKHPNTASPQDPPLVRRLVVRKRIQVQDNPSVKLPEIGTLPAPFTQGSLWWVDRGCGARIAFGDVILQGKMTGPSRTPAPTNSTEGAVFFSLQILSKV